jgi:hypothetical protein
MNDVKKLHVLVFAYSLIIVDRKPLREARALLEENFMHQSEVLIQRAVLEVVVLYAEEPIDVHQDGLDRCTKQKKNNYLKS